MTRRFALVAAATLALAGCSSPAASVPRPAAGVPATLAFTGRTLDGASFDAATLGGRPTVLWFWAPWCATCASEAMSIADLRDEYAGRLNILGIAGMGNNKDMHEFVSDLEVGAVPHLDDEPGRLWKKFGITEQSVYVLIDRNGKVTHKDWIDYQDFETVFAGLAKT